MASAKSNYGYKGAKEAAEVIGRTRSLLAGYDLDEDAKEKFTPKKYRKPRSEDKK